MRRDKPRRKKSFVAAPKTPADLLRIVAGGPGEPLLRALLARQAADRECDRLGALDALALRPHVPDEMIEAAAHLYGSQRRVAAEFARALERRQPVLTADAALGRKVRAKNRTAARAPRVDVQANIRTRDDAITSAARTYRQRHPYDAATHSTRALAAHLARMLNRPEATIRRRLRTLRLR